MHFQNTDFLFNSMPKGLLALADTAQPAIENVAIHDGFSRRNFVKMAGVSAFALGLAPLAAQTPAPATPAGLNVFQQPKSFVKIDKDGTITVTINRLEFGQGTHTGLALVLAEELDADWTKVVAVHGDADAAYADPAFGMHITGGSNALKNSYTQYRELGARARYMLLEVASREWKTPINNLRTENSRVFGPGTQSFAYGELAERGMKQLVPDKVTLKDPKDFKLIGKATPRLDARAKSNGTQQFGIDVRLPGMLTAVVAHPPVFGGKVKSVDDAAAKAIKGVRAVVRTPLDRGGEGVAVVADGYWAAKQGRDALKVEWNTDGLERVDSAQQLAQYQELAKKTGLVAIQGDADKLARLAGAPQKISAQFSFPYLAHAAMEPLNCTVAYTADKADPKVDIYTASQMPGLDAMAAARTLGVKPEAVKVHVQAAGGGFGRRAVPGSDFVTEACNVAKAARAAGINAPVRTLWTREDDTRAGYYRPLHVHRAEIGFDAQGNILAWDHVIVGQSIVTGSPFEAFLVKNGIDGTMTEGMKEPYDLPMRLSVHHPKANVPVLWWRSVGSTHTAYAMETLLDEVARATSQDPVAIRMKLMGDKHPRHKAALQLAVDQSGYGKTALPADRAYGVALHESFNSVVAMVVEASVTGGVPKLHKVTAAVHCNLAVNPLAVQAQVQGAALMGLGTCLPGAAITLKNGEVEQSNFGDYTLARITDMPQIDVHIVPSADAPTGMGEPGLPPLAPAFANAIAKLTGKTLRELPFKLA